MKSWCADLHIHTCLSPCSQWEMSPAAVVKSSIEKGIEVIAVCDHNSAENVAATRRAAANTGVAVIGGIEITTKEEVHILGLFEDEQALETAQDIVYRNLSGENSPEVFGEQLVMNEWGEIVNQNKKLLSGATALSLEEVVAMIHRMGGLAIGAHIDRPSFSIVSQLGFIPADLDLDAVEVCFETALRLPKDLAVIRSSDAHYPWEIGSRYTRFLLEKPTAGEIGMALRKIDDRKILTQTEAN